MARQINRSRLVDVVITKSAFKTWFQFIRFKQQGIRELIGKYRAFQISARKIFLHGVVLHVHGGHEQKEQIQMDVFRYRKHISVMENNLSISKLKYADLKESSSQQIQRLLGDLPNWHSRTDRCKRRHKE
eukprot:187570_1